MVTLIWGLNGIIDRQALSTGHPIEVNFVTTLTMIIVVMIYFTTAKLSGIPFHFYKNTVVFAILNGILIPTAYVIFLFALSRAGLTAVVAITSTYPIITFILAVMLLNEPVSVNKVLGIILVVAGLLIFIK
ncbi:putative membrane protein [Paenibacillus sediminis]|uniref:Membrane protein n=1 Tax=Paenibacillus sediminis TaxID=664909 RepID=A0ABS4H1E5_9BACL|nr:putative membrane protein [Paenibacillus sediminis]